MAQRFSGVCDFGSPFAGDPGQRFFVDRQVRRASREIRTEEPGPQRAVPGILVKIHTGNGTTAHRHRPRYGDTHAWGCEPVSRGAAGIRRNPFLSAGGANIYEAELPARLAL